MSAALFKRVGRVKPLAEDLKQGSTEGVGFPGTGLGTYGAVCNGVLRSVGELAGGAEDAEEDMG